MRQSAIIALLATGCLAVWLWIVFSAPAQSLPKLNAQAVSNQRFGITWPYTNAGFALQESGGLTN